MSAVNVSFNLAEKGCLFDLVYGCRYRSLLDDLLVERPSRPIPPLWQHASDLALVLEVQKRIHLCSCMDLILEPTDRRSRGENCSLMDPIDAHRLIDVPDFAMPSNEDELHSVSIRHRPTAIW